MKLFNCFPSKISMTTRKHKRRGPARDTERSYSHNQFVTKRTREGYLVITASSERSRLGPEELRGRREAVASGPSSCHPRFRRAGDIVAQSGK